MFPTLQMADHLHPEERSRNFQKVNTGEIKLLMIIASSEGKKCLARFFSQILTISSFSLKFCQTFHKRQMQPLEMISTRVILTKICWTSRVTHGCDITNTVYNWLRTNSSEKWLMFFLTSAFKLLKLFHVDVVDAVLDNQGSFSWSQWAFAVWQHLADYVIII